VSKTVLQRWLRGIPPPAWTRRPNAKDDLRAEALALRVKGWSVNDIAIELGVSKSTAWQWVRHLPLDLDSERAQAKRAKAQHMTDAQWAARRAARDERRARLADAAGAAVGDLNQRDLLLAGAAIYWCEGRKTKPWRPHECHVNFTNSDPGLLMLFLRFLESAGHHRDGLTYRVSIHESADAEAATHWWAERLGLPLDRFKRPTLKRHQPTNRRNVGREYHGCLVIDVPQSRELYWQIDGVMRAVGSATAKPFPQP
jgi:hypothetical protein